MSIKISIKIIFITLSFLFILTKTAFSNETKIKFNIGSQDIDPRQKINSYKQNSERIKNNNKYFFDKAGRLERIESLDRGQTIYTYNELGALKKINRSNCEFEEYFYDILGRRVRIEYEKGDKLEIVNFKYSTPEKSYRLGELIEKKEKFETSFFSYLHSRIVSEKKIIEGHEYFIQYKYDKKGKLIEIVYPSGVKVIYEYEKSNNPIAVYIMKNNEKVVVYKKEKTSNKENDYYGNGLVFNIESNIEKKEQYWRINKNILDIKLKFNDNGLISSIFNFVDKNKKDFFYDQYQRLITTYGPWGKISYRYDDMDNLVLINDNENKIDFYFEERSSKIRKIKKNLNEELFKYDELGRLIQKGDMSFEYNEMGCLSRIYKNNSLLTNLFYNYKRERIIEKRDKKSSYYVYDLKGRVLGEYDSEGRIIQENIYFDEKPIAFIRNGNIFYYHFDPFNFPIIITDEKGNIERKVDHDPYGKIIKQDGNLKDSLRFPGQYEIEGTPLYYNLNRNYDCDLGRYLEPDPIISYENIYQYAKCNPIAYYDLKGDVFWTYSNSGQVHREFLFTHISKIIEGGIIFGSLENGVWKDKFDFPHVCYKEGDLCLYYQVELNGIKLFSISGDLKDLIKFWSMLPQNLSFDLTFQSPINRKYPDVDDFIFEDVVGDDVTMTLDFSNEKYELKIGKSNTKSMILTNVSIKPLLPIGTILPAIYWYGFGGSRKGLKIGCPGFADTDCME